LKNKLKSKVLLYECNDLFLFAKETARANLNHSLNKFINFVFTVSEITSLNIVIILLAPSSCWCVELEGPDEVVHLLEDTATGVDLIDHILNALNIVSFSQFALNHKVVGDWNATSAVLKWKFN
jgi:hypothetical protein